MPIGVIIDAASVAVGGILGALAGHKLPENLKVQLNIVLGLCSMGMGISAVGLMKNMPAVIFAIVLGSGIGLAIGLGGWINKGAEAMQRPVTRLLHSQNSSMSQEEFTATLVTVIVLFCASGTGIYGSLDAGMTGDSTILISTQKAFMQETAMGGVPTKATSSALKDAWEYLSKLRELENETAAGNPLVVSQTKIKGGVVEQTTVKGANPAKDSLLAQIFLNNDNTIEAEVIKE